MLKQIDIENILFLDIETVPCTPLYSNLPEGMKAFWEKKSSFFRNENEGAADVYQRAGIYAEFGKIICISAGYLKRGVMYVKSYFGDDEVKILTDFKEALNTANKRGWLLCAHNGKEFDFPYIARRMLINGIELPEILSVAGKKPWEVPFLDTLELWKFGDYKHYTSLDLLAHVLNIPSPKDDIDGSMVASLYWEKKEMLRIVKYCEKDVITIVRLMQKFKGMQPLEDCSVISNK